MNWSFGEIPLFPIQPKLDVGSPTDPLEREADEIADRVMPMLDPHVTASERARPAMLRRKCEGCQKEEESHEQRTAEHVVYMPDSSLPMSTGITAAAPGTVISPSPPSTNPKEPDFHAPMIQPPAGVGFHFMVQKTLRSPGQPLDSATRNFMEPRFHHHFGQVRVYADSIAAESARALGAKAYTVGNSIVFGPGRFAPETYEGRRLLAHELAHVVQQGARFAHSGGVAEKMKRAPAPDGQPMVIRRDLLYASGWANPFKDDMEEIASCPPDVSANCTWSPHSADFMASSNGGSGVGSFDALIKYLNGKAPGSVKTLGLIGHAAMSGAFGFGGKFQPVTLTNYFDEGTLDAKFKSIEKVRNRFAKDAKIILYACDTGLKPDFLQAIADAFQVCAAGFDEELTWCFESKGNAITLRGHVVIGQAPVIQTGVPLSPKKPCKQWSVIADLKPNVTRCPKS